MSRERKQQEEWEDLIASPYVSRRRFLSLAAASAFGAAAGCQLFDGDELPGPPFTLGVASGDPLHDRVIIWTRLAPDPLNGGGMPNLGVPVIWEVAADSGFNVIVRSGFAIAHPSLAHSVHVDVPQLSPDTWYWYRFRVGSYVSPTGRTRTMPSPNSSPSLMRFAFASCQHYESGFYTAYPHMAADDLDLVVFLGDYIYEGGIGGGVRQHNGPRITTLADYRNRYALYKGDAGLQAAHANFPWIVTWDDHEVANNYAGDLADENGPPVADFLALRAAAYLAYYEHMPIRVLPPKGSELEIFRDFAFGDLASFFVADTRQYRSDQPCGDQVGPPCDEVGEPGQTMLGDDQEAWLFQRMASSQSIWNVLAQQVVYTPTILGGQFLNPDQWDGYPEPRQRINDFVVNQDIENFVVLTGDIHASGASFVSADAVDADTAKIGSEFVATGISSIFPEGLVELAELLIGQLPHVEFFNARERGYVRCEVTRDEWRADFMLVETTQAPVSSISSVAAFVVENGVPGPQPA